MLSQVDLPGPLRRVELSEREPHRAQVVASPAQRSEWLMRNVKTIGYV